jgi:hypothetical protein
VAVILTAGTAVWHYAHRPAAENWRSIEQIQKAFSIP